MWSFLIAFIVFAATCLQTLVAVADMREAHWPALEVAKAEKELIQEQPRLRRRRWRKELRSWRDDKTERSLAYVDVVAFSWALLVFASAVATIRAGMGLL